MFLDYQIFFHLLRACSHGDGGLRVGEVPRLGGVTNLSIQFLLHVKARFFWLGAVGLPLPCEQALNHCILQNKMN